jgi:hypothetical protein
MFDISQYEHSSVANKHGIDNKVPEDKISHIEELDSLLDKVGEAWASWCKKYNLGKTGLILTSGYRNPEVNSYVNGSTSSPHVEGYAADIVPTNKNTDELIKCVLDWAISGKDQYDEAIVEGLPGLQWVHISVRSSNGEQRMKTMKRETDGRLVPTKGPIAPTYSTEISEVRAVKDEDEDRKIDWTDNDVLNMTPQELDEANSEPDLFNMFLLSSWNNRVYNSQKRCVCIMNMLIEKLNISAAQAAGVVGNMLYMTDGTLATYKKSKKTYGLCDWSASDKVKFDKLHYRACTMEKSTIKDQIEFLCFMIEDHIVEKLKRCYDENTACNLFFSRYLKKKAWPDMFYNLSKREENLLREEAAARRAYASAALELWNDLELVNTSEMMKYSGNGQDGPRVSPSDDSKIYVSDGEMYEVPESEQMWVFDETYEGYDGSENLESEEHYARLFQNDIMST